MGHKGLGILFLAASLVIAACGLFIARKFRAEASYNGIGSFRITWGGLAYFCGVLLIIFGVCLVLPSVLLLIS
jgi:hypothetical protein